MGLVFVIYLTGLSLSKIPAVQSWTADVLSKSLTDYLETKVIIKDVSPGLFNRVIIDNVKIYDRNDSVLLNASRIAAKIRLLPLLDKKVQIDNAQIIGADINLYKKDAGTPLNCQFLIDKFSKKDKDDKSKAYIQIETLLARRSSLHYNIWDAQKTPQSITPHHLSISKIDVNAKVFINLPDTLGIDLKRLSFVEESGLSIHQLSFLLEANNKNADLSDFTVQTDKSELKIAQLHADYPSIPTEGNIKQWLQQTNINGVVEAQVVPSDFKSCSTLTTWFIWQVNLPRRERTYTCQGLYFLMPDRTYIWKQTLKFSISSPRHRQALTPYS